MQDLRFLAVAGRDEHIQGGLDFSPPTRVLPSSILCVERSPERGKHVRVLVDVNFPLQPLFEHSSQA